nr:MAG TPA: hypothetical protein [Caudoviricetes sp.]
MKTSENFAIIITESQRWLRVFSLEDCSAEHLNKTQSE